MPAARNASATDATLRTASCEAWCSGVDFLYSIDYEGMLDQGEIVADRDLLSLGADELRLLPADTAPVGVGAVPGALFGRKTGEPLPSAVSSARVLKLVGGTEGDPLTWLPLDGFKDEWNGVQEPWVIVQLFVILDDLI